MTKSYLKRNTIVSQFPQINLSNTPFKHGMRFHGPTSSNIPKQHSELHLAPL
ncbi:hypothetical protein EDF67_101890 [Sphingobacterium sp. JUb78]|nr:hypothetical protein [Sphingobacterium kitahiroshimense]TCR14783.1 hypothetical protein EDF67_101890 [Sphingobacterium sp. JUb78]